jgi:type IV secretory pathway VirJ component
MIRGQEQDLRLYGTRGGPVAVIASGDGGWIHLEPYVAEFLASKGYFVVGFDSKAYLSSFTKGGTTGSARLVSLPKVGHGVSVARNWEPQLVEAYRAIASSHVPEEARRSSMTGVEDLGLVEVPASGGADRGVMAVILTGDGGWADIDKSVAAGLAAAGVPVVGWSSLRYYWTPRTPEAAATDLAQIVERYSAAWRKERVLLVGYSFGADVLPFLVNRLPTPTRARIRSVSLLGLSDRADFEFHVSNWLGGGADMRHLTAPEVARMTVPATCVHAIDERDSGCLGLKGTRVRLVAVGSGHHFGGDYRRLVELILSSPPTQ